MTYQLRLFTVGYYGVKRVFLKLWVHPCWVSQTHDLLSFVGRQFIQNVVNSHVGGGTTQHFMALKQKVDL